jgi:GNAT superfamily N-acetyltransferase
MEVRKVKVLSEPFTVWEIAGVYQTAFAHEPWLEGYRCPLCNSVFGFTAHLSLCPNCRKEDMLINLIEYWPISRVITDFYTENTKENAICLVAEEDGSAVGFAWRYRFDISPSTEVKISATGLSKIYMRSVFYLDECAVLPKLQGQGIGKTLIQEILKKQPYDIMILRTLEGSLMQKLIEGLGGEYILPVSEGRIIMKIIKNESLHKFISPPHY